jgi:hypothetical protein
VIIEPSFKTDTKIMKKTVVLAYRNNQTWDALCDSLQRRARKVAQKHESELLVKIFTPNDGSDLINAWIKTLGWESEVVYIIADGTVKQCLKNFDFDVESYDKFTDLNDYLAIRTPDTFNHISIDLLYSTCFSRLAAAFKPEVWVIVQSKITDYDPLGIMGGEKYGADVTQEDQMAYIEKFKALIPAGQKISVYGSDPSVKSEFAGKKKVVIAHHHAQFDFEVEEGSIWIDTYPSSFLKSLTGIIQTDDLIGEDVLDVIRKRIEKI